jgi:nucleoside-diphosphate-sugar epimerase
LARAKRTLGFEPQFKLQDAVKDLAEWMRRYPA